MSPSSNLTTPRSGSCLCKLIKYEIIGDPISFQVCHCMNCKKSSGSAFMSNLTFSKEKVHVLEGEEHLKFYLDNDTGSGSPLYRYFCINCGSSLFIKSNKKLATDITVVTLGSLDDHLTNWVPRAEYWPERRQHWIKGIELRKKKKDAKL